MDRIHTETMLRDFPGLCICALENGGMMFTDDGDYVDAVDEPQDPLRNWLDFENGDGDKGRRSGDAEDFRFEDEADSIHEEEDVLFETREEELARLIDEQQADDEGDPVPYENLPIANASGERTKVRSKDAHGTLTRRSCDRKAQYALHDSHGFHGRKPGYKDRHGR